MQWLVRQLQNEIFQSLRKQEILDLHTTNILYVILCTSSKNIQIYTHPGNPKHLSKTSWRFNENKKRVNIYKNRINMWIIGGIHHDPWWCPLTVALLSTTGRLVVGYDQTCTVPPWKWTNLFPKRRTISKGKDHLLSSIRGYSLVFRGLV